MLLKPIDALTIDDIEKLVADQVAESRTLDFKRELVGPREEDRREFLSDVSAFANTAGGDLVFGIEESGGVAVAFHPIKLQDPDAQIRRLEDILRSGLEPRLPTCNVRWISGANGDVLIIRTPRSWLAPHRVIFRDHSKFYARNSAGKYALDVTELRAAFTGSEGIADRIRAFRRERISLIEADEGALPLKSGAKLLFHIVPLSAFTNPLSTKVNSNGPNFRPLGTLGFNFLHTLEGFATYSGREDSPDGARAYTLAFRNGIIEAVACISSQSSTQTVILPHAIEKHLLNDAESFFDGLKKIGVEPPFYVALSLCAVRGQFLDVPNRFPDKVPRALRRDVLQLPESFVSESAPDIGALLRPMFDQVWQAFGFAASQSFNAKGQYIGG